MTHTSPQSTLEIRQPDDWHVHLRDGDALLQTVPETARVFARAIVMPNLAEPVVTADLAQAYRQRILAQVPKDVEFTPLMTLYLTDETSTLEIQRGFHQKILTAAKLYPANATTNAHAGVSDPAKLTAVFAEMERLGMPLLIHGEVVDHDVDVFDREKVFIDRHLTPLVRSFPGLKIVFEHITTSEAVAFVRAHQSQVAATITAHHLLYNRTDMFRGGIRPHLYCLPVAKRESHRLALRKAAVSGESCFFLGTDSAPHSIGKKLADCGCAGIYSAPLALETYAEVFEEEGALERLENFASVFGPKFYGLPLNPGRVRLRRQAWQVPTRLPLGSAEVQPLRGGEKVSWRAALLPTHSETKDRK